MLDAAGGARRDPRPDRGPQPRPDGAAQPAVRGEAEARAAARRPERRARQVRGARQDAEVANKLEGQLVSAQQQLTEEMKKVLGAQYRRAPQDRRRRPAGRQRVHHLHHRHVGQHGELRVAADAAQDAGGARRLPDGEGLAGDERRGQLHVPVVPRPLAARHARRSARSCSTGCATGSRSATRARSRASSRRSAPITRAAGASACTCSATSSRARRSTRSCARST